VFNQTRHKRQLKDELMQKYKLGPHDPAHEQERAQRIIAQHADADMSSDEIAELLIQNGVGEGVALSIAQDMRGKI
jgi:hypothetical protein